MLKTWAPQFSLMLMQLYFALAKFSSRNFRRDSSTCAIHRCNDNGIIISFSRHHSPINTPRKVPALVPLPQTLLTREIVDQQPHTMMYVREWINWTEKSTTSLCRLSNFVGWPWKWIYANLIVANPVIAMPRMVSHVSPVESASHMPNRRTDKSETIGSDHLDLNP